MWPSSSSPARREHRAPVVDDHRAPARAQRPAGRARGRVLADLVGGDHERLVLDRARAQQDLPVRARRRDGEGGRHGDDPRAADREDPVELREADVVADRQAQPDAAGGRADDDLLARLLVLGLAVDHALDDDVEHVDLAVGGADLAVGADVQRRVAQALGALDALGDRAGDELDAELARDRARPRHRRAVERLRARAQVVAAAERAPLLGQHDELRAVRRGRAREAVRALEVAREVGRAGQLDGGDADGAGSRIDWSVNGLDATRPRPAMPAVAQKVVVSILVQRLSSAVAGLGGQG